MKKLVAVLGSDRAGSVSKKVADSVIQGAKDNNCQVVIYDTLQMNIKGCRGCGACRANGTDCVIQDDMQKYYEDLKTCDALLITAPNYYSQIAGHMMTYMNRHYCLTNADRTSRLPKGIKLITVYSQGAPEGYEKYVDNYNWYTGLFTSKGMELVRSIDVGGNSDLSENSMIITEAYKAGKSI